MRKLCIQLTVSLSLNHIFEVDTTVRDFPNYLACYSAVRFHSFVQHRLQVAIVELKTKLDKTVSIFWPLNQFVDESSSIDSFKVGGLFYAPIGQVDWGRWAE